MGNLTDLKAKNIKPGDKAVADGTVTGLRLEPGGTKGHGKWVLRFVSPETDKRRDMGLGSYPDVSIIDVRKVAGDARDLIRNGIDPIEARKDEVAKRKINAQAFTFEVAARQVHESLKPGWANPKHAAQWITTLDTYVFPKIGSRKIKDLKAKDFADALVTIWIDKPETASRVKQRCNAVMDWCVAQDMIGANPVSVVSKLLPQQPSKRKRVIHQPSMPWQDVPEFVQEILHIGKSNLTRLMLEFLILTAARSGEVRAMTWDEVDLDKSVWIVPAERMKAKVEHRVPLSDRAVEILNIQQDEHQTLVFPSITGKVPSDMILTRP